MKKILTGMTLLSGLLWSGSLSSAEITNMISKIKEERVGISLKKLDSTENPFILKRRKAKEPNKKVEKSEKKVYTETEYVLKAILNHSAFINKKWYKVGSKLGSYRISYIGRKSVTLKSENGNKILSLKKKKKKFIRLNQGNI